MFRDGPPVTGPQPSMTLTTPSGTTPSLVRSRRLGADKGVIPEGLRSKAHHSARAGPRFYIADVIEGRQRKVSVGTPPEMNVTSVRHTKEAPGEDEPNDTDGFDPSVPRFGRRTLR